MLFSLGHGQRILLPSDAQIQTASSPPDTIPISAAAPGAANESGIAAIPLDSDPQSFGYIFPDAPGIPGDDSEVVNTLIGLANALVEPQGDQQDADSSIPPIFTYFGQFIDHDITANTDRDAPQPNPISVITGPTLSPLDRDDVVTNILNLRNGSLRLDSLYGEGPTDTPFTIKVRNALRDPNDRSKMRLGTLTPSSGDVITPPDDGLADLPRLGDMIDDPESGLSKADIDALPDGAFKDSFNENGQIKRARAMIGDGRNDENLLVAQLHLAFLRFHNAVAENLKAELTDEDERFERAKRLTIFIYQWLVVNVYLPAICQPSVVENVKTAGAPIYKAFRNRVASGAAELPLPLEFSVAAFRFGHSMIRAAYDFNSNFGRPGRITSEATFRLLFSFTGNDNLGETETGVSNDRLPSNWVIDWDRFAKQEPDQPDHRARAIDTVLAPPLFDMFNESSAGGELQRILRNLAERNLRRSHRLNIPSGQASIQAINDFDASDESRNYPKTDPGIAVIPPEVLAEGNAGPALRDGDLLETTPLWLYCLREAEITEGDTLGPLGSRIVAETLIGLVIEDDQSYWHEGQGQGSWSPTDAPIGSSAITDLPSMLRAAGVMR